MMMLLRVGFSREMLWMISQYTKRRATVRARVSQRLSIAIMIRHDVHQSRNAYKKKTTAKQIKGHMQLHRRRLPNPNSLVVTQHKPSQLSKLPNPSARPPFPSPLAANRKVKSSIRTEHERKTRVPATSRRAESRKACVLTRLLWSRTFRMLEAGSW
jgi:hypothetical protein